MVTNLKIISETHAYDCFFISVCSFVSYRLTSFDMFRKKYMAKSYNEKFVMKSNTSRDPYITFLLKISYNVVALYLIDYHGNKTY